MIIGCVRKGDRGIKGDREIFNKILYPLISSPSISPFLTQDIV
jgi:hypothetical protein